MVCLINYLFAFPNQYLRIINVLDSKVSELSESFVLEFNKSFRIFYIEINGIYSSIGNTLNSFIHMVAIQDCSIVRGYLHFREFLINSLIEDVGFRNKVKFREDFIKNNVIIVWFIVFVINNHDLVKEDWSSFTKSIRFDNYFFDIDTSDFVNVKFASWSIGIHDDWVVSCSLLADFSAI